MSRLLWVFGITLVLILLVFQFVSHVLNRLFKYFYDQSNVFLSTEIFSGYLTCLDC